MADVRHNVKNLRKNVRFFFGGVAVSRGDDISGRGCFTFCEVLE